MADEKDNLIGRPKRNVPEGEIAKKPEDAKSAFERAVALTKEYAEKSVAERAAKVKKGEVVARSLRVRKEHNTTSEMVAGLVAGNEVTIYETWTDGKNTWVRIGADQWAAMIYEGETYIKLAE